MGSGRLWCGWCWWCKLCVCGDGGVEPACCCGESCRSISINTIGISMRQSTPPGSPPPVSNGAINGVSNACVAAPPCSIPTISRQMTRFPRHPLFPSDLFLPSVFLPSNAHITCCSSLEGFTTSGAVPVAVPSSPSEGAVSAVMRQVGPDAGEAGEGSKGGENTAAAQVVPPPATFGTMIGSVVSPPEHALAEPVPIGVAGGGGRGGVGGVSAAAIPPSYNDIMGSERKSAEADEAAMVRQAVLQAAEEEDRDRLLQEQADSDMALALSMDGSGGGGGGGGGVGGGGGDGGGGGGEMGEVGEGVQRPGPAAAGAPPSNNVVQQPPATVLCSSCGLHLHPPRNAPLFRCPCGTVLRAVAATTTTAAAAAASAADSFFAAPPLAPPSTPSNNTREDDAMTQSDRDFAMALSLSTT